MMMGKYRPLGKCKNCGGTLGIGLKGFCSEECRHRFYGKDYRPKDKPKKPRIVYSKFDHDRPEV